MYTFHGIKFEKMFKSCKNKLFLPIKYRVVYSEGRVIQISPSIQFFFCIFSPQRNLIFTKYHAFIWESLPSDYFHIIFYNPCQFCLLQKFNFFWAKHVKLFIMLPPLLLSVWLLQYVMMIPICKFPFLFLYRLLYVQSQNLLG